MLSQQLRARQREIECKNSRRYDLRRARCQALHQLVLDLEKVAPLEGEVITDTSLRLTAPSPCLIIVAGDDSFIVNHQRQTLNLSATGALSYLRP